MMLPANITSSQENSVLSIAASSNKGLLIRFLNEQVEDGFYTLVIDYLKDSNFDLANMMVDDDVKAQCTKLYELAEFVDEQIKKPGKYEIEEWIEPLFRFVYGNIDPTDIDAPISTSGIYRYSIWLFFSSVPAACRFPSSFTQSWFGSWKLIKICLHHTIVDLTVLCCLQSKRFLCLLISCDQIQ